MLELYKEGIVAHIQIHDELDISVENDKQAKKIVEIMESAVDLEIPNKVDYEKGKNWGDIHQGGNIKMNLKQHIPHFVKEHKKAIAVVIVILIIAIII